MTTALRLRLLPASAADPDDALLGKQPLSHQTAANCAYLCAEMVAEPPQDHRVCCFRWPYRQRWPRDLVRNMVKEILKTHRASGTDVRAGQLKVAVELYHFLDHQRGDDVAVKERALCEDICTEGMNRLLSHLELDFSRMLGGERANGQSDLVRVAAVSPHGLCAETEGAANAWVLVEVRGVRVGLVDGRRPHSEAQKRCYTEALDTSAGHWRDARARLAEMAPPGAECRAVVLADTPVMARHQAAWAQAQWRVDADADGRLFEVPLLRKGEPVLVLPITGILPSLEAQHTCSRDASGVLESAWDPWKEALAQLGKVKAGAKARVEACVGKRNRTAALPHPSKTNVELQLHHMSVYYSCSESFRNTGEVDIAKARIAVADFFDLDSTTREQRYRLLWFAVIVPQRREEVEQWLRDELRRRVEEKDFEPLYWAVARYWAVAMRTRTYRGVGLGSTNDPIDLGDLLQFMDGLRPHERNLRTWREHLRQETLWVGQELRHEEIQKGSGRRRVPTSVWRVYSTDDPIAARAGLSLEMQQRAMAEFDGVLELAERERNLTFSGGHTLLFVAGTMARRLFVLSRFIDRFTVMVLNGKDAPQGGTSKKLASLCVTRRIVYQLPEGTRRRLVDAGASSGVVDTPTGRLVAAAVAEACLEGEPEKAPPEGELEEGAKHFQEGKTWCARACRKPVRNQTWGTTPAAQSTEVLAAVADVVRRLDEAEERHRASLPKALRPALAALWRQQLTYCLHNAASASVLGLGDPVPLFLETFLEQLCRAAEEPLLRHLATLRAWDTTRQGRNGRLAYSQELKQFMREVLMPLCSGPAALLRLLRWLECANNGIAAAGRCLTPWMRLGATSGLTAKEQARIDHVLDARSARRPDSPLPQDDAFLEDVAPHFGLWQLEWERRRFLARAALGAFRRQAAMAGDLHAAGAPPWLLQSALARLPIAAGTRYPSGRRSLSGPAAPSQRNLLALLESSGAEQAALRDLLTAPDPPVLPPPGLAGRGGRGWLADLPPLADDAPPPRVLQPAATPEGAETFLSSWQGQLDLSGAVRRARHFMEHYTQKEIKRLDATAARSAYSVLEKLEPAYTECNDTLSNKRMEWYLLNAVWQRCQDNVDLGAALDDALEYWHSFYSSRDKDKVGAALQVVRRELLHHLHRSPGGRLDAAHRAQRREQVDAYCRNQRAVYCDRPRARGVLDGFGHRLKGESEEVRCWIAEGEAVRPWPRVCRALAADMYAEAWYCSWITGAQAVRKAKRHDLSRADTELARDVLCTPPGAPPRGLSVVREDGERIIARARIGWKPCTRAESLGKPRPSPLEERRPAQGQGAPRGQELLGAHEISQVILRRLVAHREDTARLACLLREPISSDDGAPPRESYLALATCASLKRALEPITHAVELWPLFLKEIGAAALRACTSDGEFCRALTAVGCPVPTAARVAAHRWLQRSAPDSVRDDYTLPVDGVMLEALARAVQNGELPPPLPPSPVWDESEVVGRKRAASSELPLPAAAAKRLRVFRAQSEEEWYRGQRLVEHFGKRKREHDWEQQGRRKSKGVPQPCRPWTLVNRRLWVMERGLPMTPWDDAGRLPDIFWLSAVRQPVVICPRTAGRRTLGGSLPFGPYTPEEHARYVGDMGECILFGADQQNLLRAFKSRGLSFLAVSLDRVSVLKQFMARASVLYLLGRWRHFPLFLGEGKSSFPWLGARWHDGILYLQQLVRQQLREELLSLEPQLEPLRRAWASIENQKQARWRDLARPEGLARLRQATGDPNVCVPALALQVEALQEQALGLAPPKVIEEALADTDSDASDAEAGRRSRPRCLKILDRTLADRPDRRKGAKHVVLTFPTERHIREVCSAPLSRGGRLMPKSLSQWLEDDHILAALETSSWPQLGHGDLRQEEPAPASHARQPLELGQHIVVMPDWATYVRGLSERAGRGPRDGHAPWRCWALGPPEAAAPEEAHVAKRYWEALREAQSGLAAALGHREVVGIYGRIFPEQRVRTRGGDREEAAEGDPTYHPEGVPGAPGVDKEMVRNFLERYPQFFQVSTCVDLRQGRGFRGATLCLTKAELVREKKRLGPGRNLDGARYLHGTHLPRGVSGTSAQSIVQAEHNALIEECAALESELEREREEAEGRTAAELALPRWPSTAQGVHSLHGLHGLHGSRAPEAFVRHAGTDTAAVVLVAGRAEDFEESAQCPPGFARAHICVALYPPSEALPPGGLPCYELQVASLRLLERQLFRLFEDRRILLLAVGAEAQQLFEGLHMILCPGIGASDLVPLPGERIPKSLRERERLTLAQSAVGWCSLGQLLDEEGARKLCSRPEHEELRLDWLALRAQLSAATFPAC